MKRCPTCNRTYTDDALQFCLDDGTPLSADAPQAFDPQATIAMPDSRMTTPPPTQYGSGARQAPPPPQTPWTPPAMPGTASTPPAAKRSMLPWILGIGAVLVIGFIGIVIAIVLIASAANSNGNANNSNNSNNANKANTNSNSNRGATNTNNAASTGTVITSTDGVSQITVPSGWTKTTDLNDKAELQVVNRSAGMYMILLTDNKADYSSAIDLDTHSKSTLSALTKAMTSSNVVGPTSMTINGSPALQYEITGEIKGLNIVYLHTTVETEDHFQQIVAWTLQSKYPSQKDELQSIIQSFKETQ